MAKELEAYKNCGEGVGSEQKAETEAEALYYIGAAAGREGLVS